MLFSSVKIKKNIYKKSQPSQSQRREITQKAF